MPAAPANFTAAPLPPPSIPAGSANLNDLQNADLYCRDVKRQRLNSTADAQDHSAAFLCKFELAADQSAVIGGAAAPDVAAAIIAAFAPGGVARPAITAAINECFAPGGTAAVALAALENKIQVGLDALETRRQVNSRNNSARASNFRCLLVPDLPLRHLAKELPDHPAGMANPAGMVAPVAVGTRAPAAFPASLTAVRQLSTHAAFDEMYWFYNDPALAPGGNLATRCRAFEDFVTS